MAEGVHYVVSSDVNVSMFNGASPFEDFEEEIGALLRARPGLSAQQKKDLVIRNLGRDVRSELSCQPEKGTAEELLRALKDIYGDRRPLNTLALEFYGCRQGAYETIRHYSHRLNQSFRNLQSGHSRDSAGPVPEILLRDQFISGLRSEGLRIHLIQKRIADPESTFLRVRELALQLSSEEVEESSSCSATQAAMAAQHHSLATLPPASPAATSTPSAELKQMRELLERLTERMDRMETGRGRQRRRGDMRCYRCNQPGHFARECRAPGTLTRTGITSPCVPSLPGSGWWRRIHRVYHIVATSLLTSQLARKSSLTLLFSSWLSPLKNASSG